MESKEQSTGEESRRVSVDVKKNGGSGKSVVTTYFGKRLKGRRCREKEKTEEEGRSLSRDKDY